MFTNLPPKEIERRRAASIEEMKRRDRKEFEAWYQEKCDEYYWRNGQCCAGCDHWESDSSNFGACSASKIVSGNDVLRRLGIFSATYTPPPGHALTPHDYHCGLFRDDFDWSTLDDDYLRRIGALEGGKLKPLPARRAECEAFQPEE